MTWRGPFFLHRGWWWPTTFVLYRGELHCMLTVGHSTLVAVWMVGTARVSFQGDASFSSGLQNGPALWLAAAGQIAHRLRAAVDSPDAYNRRVERLLPKRCRVGRLKREWTWPEGSRKPLSGAGLRRLEWALREGRDAPTWRTLSVQRYLEMASWAYDAAFSDMRGRPPLEKYRSTADSRHGGMLDLPRRDARAFEKWFRSRDWLGAHPWEIVFSHPHGILLSPAAEDAGWRFHLGVDTLGLYGAAVRMATALGLQRVPFSFYRSDEVVSALRGEDWVEIGPFYDQLPLELLEERRPGAVARVQWDPPPKIAPRARPSRPAR